MSSEVSILSHETLTEVLDNISTMTFITAASGINHYNNEVCRGNNSRNSSVV